MDKKQKGERKNEEKITGNSDCGLYDRSHLREELRQCMLHRNRVQEKMK